MNRTETTNFLRLVREMRQAQKRYFTNGRKFEDLNQSKKLERAVDMILDGQTKLNL
jgi:hypothetical protein